MKLFVIVLFFCFSSSSMGLIHGNIDHFHQLYEKYLPICQSKHNFVASRGDGFTTTEDNNRYLPWSLLSGSLHHFLDHTYLPKQPLIYGINQHNHTSTRFIHTYTIIRKNIRYCQTIEEILLTIAHAYSMILPKCKLRWISGEVIDLLFQ